jgi:hypothetical protein
LADVVCGEPVKPVTGAVHEPPTVGCARPVAAELRTPCKRLHQQRRGLGSIEMFGSWCWRPLHPAWDKLPPIAAAATPATTTTTAAVVAADGRVGGRFCSLIAW